MSTGGATIISPMITKQIIDNIKKEDDGGCILFISSSNNGNSSAQTPSGGSPSSVEAKDSPVAAATMASLNAINGHNYISASKLPSTNNNTSTVTIHRADRLNAVTTTANRAPTIKRIDFISRQQSGSGNNIDLYKNSASLDGSPSSSPLSFTESHQQDMYCSSTVSGDCTSGAVVDTNDLNKARDSSPKRLCLVCGDTASGFHYGVASCEACKAFFKRTIQGNIEYTCPATNNCEINKRRRKACQACRFQKCLRMGMLKEGVRLDRVRGGRQKYRRTSEAPYQPQSFNVKKTNVEDNRMVAALISCEPEPISNINGQISSPGSSHSSLSSVSSSQYKNLCILSDLVDKELVAIIGWAKQIPGFSDLILNDQMRLLQSTWAEILSLSIAFRSHQFSSPPNTPAGLSPNNASSTTNPLFNKLVYTNDFIMDDQQASSCNADEYFHHMIYLIKRLHQMKIHREEFLLMKALLLTNADIQLENFERVAKLRETLFHALQEVATILHPQNAVSHLCQLLVCLPMVRQLDSLTRRYWQTILQEGSVPMNKLFVEMLESNVS